jgi:hypothetical protein
LILKKPHVCHSIGAASDGLQDLLFPSLPAHGTKSATLGPLGASILVVTGVIESRRNQRVTLQVEVPLASIGKKSLTVSDSDVSFAVVLFKVAFTTLNTTVRSQTSAAPVTFDFNQSERSSR